MKENIYGLDFGFNNPSALTECYVHDGVPYIKELIYESHLTNSDLIERMKGFGIKNQPIYCDAAEPQRIEELRKAGFNALPADKSVKDGIDYLKRFRLTLDPDSPNILSEIRGYSYRKKGDQVIDEPVKFRDHALDSARYCLFTDGKKTKGQAIPLSMATFSGIRNPQDNMNKPFFRKGF